MVQQDALARKSGVNPIIGGPLPSIESLVSLLSDESSAISPRDFLSIGREGRKVPGLYSWWVSKEGAADLTVGLGHRVSAGLIYAGLAGATRWPSGKKSTNTLWARIATMHLGSKHEFSTFRRTVGAILASAKGRDEIDEIALTEWMHLHLRVQVIPYDDADSLGQIEEEVLAALDPPLNLKGMRDSDLRKRLKDLRRAVVR